MLKKLKRQFVSLSMLLVSIVVVIFYVFTSAIIFFRITEGVQHTLRDYSSETYFSKYFRIGDDTDDFTDSNAIDSSSICVVSVNETGTVSILDVGHAYMEEGVLYDSVRIALHGESNFGIIAKNNLFYYKTLTAFGYRIAFADSTRYFTYLKDILLDDFVLFLVVILVLWIINRRLASIFIKPVEKAWEQQQNFIADASHELKTPLTVILANCGILQAHPQNTVEEQLNWIESTNEEAVHMKELVDKMLYLAKSENAKQATVFSDIDLTELVTRVALQFEPVAFEKGVLLEYKLEENVHVLADPTSVNQIIHILIDNAVKYAGEKGSVCVTLKRRQNFVLLGTHNSGSPIPPEDLPHIFERFYRSDKARTSGGGYGLGLAICKTLVEQQKAEISVTSTAEAGTDFTVKFKTRSLNKKNMLR
ncbi:MAG: HAMP domain-containing histidine kinase [Clostridia bacterium]|nr:HAMP domain-containing histidine kinase [Clostridia bacterium]